jgi:hypothetical protein
MLTGSGPAGQVVLAPGAIEPEAVADALVAALADGSFLVLPHPEVRDYFVQRATDTDRWLRGMSRLQQRVEARRAEAQQAEAQPTEAQPTEAQQGAGE